MGLATDLAAGPPTTNRQSCTIGFLLARLDARDREALTAAMASGVSGNWIADVIRRNGTSTTGQTVNRHRAGRCQCLPTT